MPASGDTARHSDFPDDRDPEEPYVNIAKNARDGIEAETGKMEELRASRQHLTRTLRAVLAERMIEAPIEELEDVMVELTGMNMVKVLQTARESSAIQEDGSSRQLDPDSTIAARKLLRGGRSPRSQGRTGRHK